MLPIILFIILFPGAQEAEPELRGVRTSVNTDWLGEEEEQGVHAPSRTYFLEGPKLHPGLIHSPFQFCLGFYCLETEKIPQNLVSLRKLKSLRVTTGPDAAPAWADFLRGPQCRARPPICPLVLAVTVLMPVTIPSYILTGLP